MTQSTPTDPSDAVTQPTASEFVPPREGGVVLGGTGWQTLSQVVVLAVNLLLTPYVITGLGSERFSIYLLVSAIIAVLAQFDGGLGASVLRYFTIFAGRDDRSSATRLLTTAALLVVVVMGVCTLAIVLLAPVVLDFFRIATGLRDEAIFLLRTCAALMAAVIIRNMLVSLLYAHNRFAVTALTATLGQAVYAGGLILTVQQGWGLWGVTATFVAQQIVGTVAVLPWVLGYIDKKALRFTSRADTLEFLAYAWQIQLAGLIQLAIQQKDQLVAGRLLSAQRSGPYGQGANFAMQLYMVPINALHPMQALFGRAVGARGSTGALPEVTRMQRLWVRVVTGWSAVGIPAAYYGVSVWLPASFAIAAEVAVIRLCGYMFVLWAVVLVLWCLTLGHSGIEVRYRLVALLANACASLLLLPVLGMVGVVLGTAIGDAVAAAALAIYVRRRLPVRPPVFFREIPFARGALAASLTCLIEWALHPLMPTGPVGLVMCGLVAAPILLVYLVTVAGVGPALRLVKRSGRRRVRGPGR